MSIPLYIFPFIFLSVFLCRFPCFFFVLIKYLNRPDEFCLVETIVRLSKIAFPCPKYLVYDFYELRVKVFIIINNA